MKTIAKTALLALILNLAGCASPGMLSTLQTIERIIPIAQKAGEAIRPMTEEEEYYLGRAVASMILNQYQLYSNEPLHHYLNLVGQTVVLSSERPYTYGGYHFAVLDTEEVNAFACPGGIIFITKGMLKSVKNEEELAAVLAHEVAHVSLRHGVSAIKASRWTGVVMAIGVEAAKRYTSSEISKLVSLFEGSIDDVFKTVVVKGYGRDQEMEADGKSLVYTNTASYNPEGLPNLLDRLMVTYKESEGGLFKTHPGAKERSEKAKEEIKEKGWKGSESNIRTNRFMSIARLL